VCARVCLFKFVHIDTAKSFRLLFVDFAGTGTVLEQYLQLSSGSSSSLAWILTMNRPQAFSGD
jgi:hypothetical protein